MNTALAFRFPGGRYHATPWDTHVNEGEVEWPPSPWRLLRALVAVWHRKMDPDSFPEEELSVLVHRLAGEHPLYRLPPGTHAHSRHYMPERSGKGERRTLVFDAFVRLDPTHELVMVWPDVALDAHLRARMSELVVALGYLGRAESWVEGRLLEDWDGSLNCSPASRAAAGTEVGPGVESIQLPAPLPPDRYASWRNEKVEELGLTGRRLKVGERRLLATLPERLIDAMRVETAQIRKEGWSRPPALEFVHYHRPGDALRPRRALRTVSASRSREITTARLTLSGRPLPRLEDAVKIGEVTRLAAIRKADDLSTEDGEVPGVLSGHDMPEDNRHEHAFYLPEDASGDGRLDHVIVHADAGLEMDSVAALYRIARIWLDEGSEWRVTLEDYGPAADFSDHPYLGRSRAWSSATPYLHPWYRKEGFNEPEQIRRECRARGLPEPRLERLPHLRVAGRTVRPVHFHRFRSRRGLRQPDTRGSFWRLVFPEAVRGPLALGFGCHFGLGVFEKAGD